jgi:hypothetical protein
MWGISCLSEEILASHKEHCCMELFGWLVWFGLIWFGLEWMDGWMDGWNLMAKGVEVITLAFHSVVPV